MHPNFSPGHDVAGMSYKTTYFSEPSNSATSDATATDNNELGAGTIA